MAVWLRGLNLQQFHLYTINVTDFISLFYLCSYLLERWLTVLIFPVSGKHVVRSNKMFYERAFCSFQGAQRSVFFCIHNHLQKLSILVIEDTFVCILLKCLLIKIRKTSPILFLSCTQQNIIELILKSQRNKHQISCFRSLEFIHYSVPNRHFGQHVRNITQRQALNSKLYVRREGADLL